jgi:YihY family inner membrane protein
MTHPDAATDPAADDADRADRPGWAERIVRRLDRFQQRYAVIGFPFAVFQKFGNDQAGAKATLMAYYGFFALFPLLLLFATVLGFLLPGNPQLQASLINSALANFPVIGDQLRSAVHPLEGNTGALVIGIIGTLYGAFGIGLSAQNAMNSVWNIPFVKWPSFWYRYARTVAFIFLLGVPTVATTVLTTIATVVRSGASVTLIAIIGSAVISFIVFVLAFMLLTAEPLGVRDVALGALCATVFWQALQLIGTWYINRQLHNASATYGIFAVVITLLSWLYLASQLTLWAAEINVVARYRLWPRSITQPPLTKADRLVFQRLVRMEVRRPEVEAATKFTEEADFDPLRLAAAGRAGSARSTRPGDDRWRRPRPAAPPARAGPAPLVTRRRACGRSDAGGRPPCGC